MTEIEQDIRKLQNEIAQMYLDRDMSGFEKAHKRLKRLLLIKKREQDERMDNK